MSIHTNQNKVAIVTGAAQGIGAGTARLLLERGYSMSLVDRNEDELAHAVAGLDEARTLRVVADVSSAGDMARVAAETLARFGRIDALHSNAAIVGAGGRPPQYASGPSDDARTGQRRHRLHRLDSRSEAIGGARRLQRLEICAGRPY